jgi:hypothetical protein
MEVTSEQVGVVFILPLLLVWFSAIQTIHYWQGFLQVATAQPENVAPPPTLAIFHI